MVLQQFFGHLYDEHPGGNGIAGEVGLPNAVAGIQENVILHGAGHAAFIRYVIEAIQ